MAEKIATLFNSHYRSDLNINSSISGVFSSSSSPYVYYRTIRKGIVEVDENGFKHFNFPLQCLDVEIQTEYDASVCCRLLNVNHERLISVFICSERYVFVLNPNDRCHRTPKKRE